MFPAATAAPFSQNVARRGIFVYFCSICQFGYVLSFIIVDHGIRDRPSGKRAVESRRHKGALRSTTDASKFPPGPSRSHGVPHVVHVVIKI